MCANTSLAVHHHPHPPVTRRIERVAGAVVWFVRTVAEIWREWHSSETCLRSLAALGDDDLPNLSETGQALRREARRKLRAS